MATISNLMEKILEFWAAPFIISGNFFWAFFFLFLNGFATNKLNFIKNPFFYKILEFRNKAGNSGSNQLSIVAWIQSTFTFHGIFTRYSTCLKSSPSYNCNSERTWELWFRWGARSCWILFNRGGNGSQSSLSTG